MEINSIADIPEEVQRELFKEGATFGKREGSGRPAGAVTKRTREIADRALAEGKAPLEVMLDNMRHFQQVALDAEAVLSGLTVEEIGGRDMSPDEQFKMLLATP